MDGVRHLACPPCLPHQMDDDLDPRRKRTPCGFRGLVIREKPWRRVELFGGDNDESTREGHGRRGGSA